VNKCHDRQRIDSPLKETLAVPAEEISASPTLVLPSILRASATIAVLGVASKAVGMLKEFVMAYRFGTSDAVDALNIAMVVPSFLVGVFGSALTAALIPTYMEVRTREGRGRATTLVQSTSAAVMALALALLVLLALGMPAIISIAGGQFSEHKLQLTRTLYYLLLPVVFTGILTALWGAVLNAEGAFGLPSFTPALVALAQCAAVVLTARFWGIFAAAAGIILGHLLQAVCLVNALRRRRIVAYPNWHGLSPELRTTAAQYGPVLAGSTLLAGTTLVDQSMAAYLPAGSVAALGYGNKVVALVVGATAMALGTAVLPHFSQLVARADWKGVRSILRKYTLGALAVSGAATVVLIVGSDALVRLFYQHGAFGPDDTLRVSRIQIFYALQIPFQAIGILYVRLISALRGNQILFWGTALSFPLNFVLNLIFMRRWGTSGIALSTSCVYATASVFLVSSCLVLLRHAETASDVKHI
jgi:putative peptidoglycan lipid II flippase